MYFWFVAEVRGAVAGKTVPHYTIASSLELTMLQNLVWQPERQYCNSRNQTTVLCKPYGEHIKMPKPFLRENLHSNFVLMIPMSQTTVLCKPYGEHIKMPKPFLRENLHSNFVLMIPMSQTPCQSCCGLLLAVVI